LLFNQCQKSNFSLQEFIPQKTAMVGIRQASLPKQTVRVGQKNPDEVRKRLPEAEAASQPDTGVWQAKLAVAGVSEKQGEKRPEARSINYNTVMWQVAQDGNLGRL
jgi:uncharacterized lipoprotein YddW (UPF0748 family)